MKLKIKNKKSSVTIFDSTMTELVTELVTMSQKNNEQLNIINNNHRRLTSSQEDNEW